MGHSSTHPPKKLPPLPREGISDGCGVEVGGDERKGRGAHLGGRSRGTCRHRIGITNRAGPMAHKGPQPWGGSSSYTFSTALIAHAQREG